MLPKFSIVTPTFNSEAFLAETIDSVISQRGDFSIEYILMDGGSKDETVTIVDSYINKLKKNEVAINCKSVEILFFSAKDEGMYDAINKGFQKATGQYYAWINSDDIYMPGALQTILVAFQNNPDIEWLKGVTSYINNSSTIYKTGSCSIYAKRWLRLGVYGRASYFVQQDSVFWRSTLWNKVKGIDASLKMAGDFYLWRQFSRYASLVSINAFLSCFRKVEGQLSSDLKLYQAEMDSVCSLSRVLRVTVKAFNRIERYMPIYFSGVLHRFLFGKLTFSAIKINASGEAIRASGSYYRVRLFLDSDSVSEHVD